MKKLNFSADFARRLFIASLPYAVIVFGPTLAHPIFAAVGASGALPGITTGSEALKNSFIQAAGAVGIGGMAWGSTHLVHRPEDWVGGMTRIGAGGACTYVATQAGPVSTQFGAGVLF